MVGLPHLSTLLAGVVLVLAAPVVDKRDLVVPGKYIVTLKPGFSVAEATTHLNWVRSVHARRGVSSRDVTGIEKVYSLSDFHAYAGSFDASTLDEIRTNYQVAAIEPDMIWTLDSSLVTQSPSPWNLASLSHRTPNHTTYFYHPLAGANTFAYVIDSGIRTTHSEFAPARAVLGYNAIPGSSSTDHLSHGTHVAATIAGRTYGVAKLASVVAVKVFDRSLASTTSVVMDGYAWAVNNITATPGRAARSVVSLSLGGPVSAAFNGLVAKAYEAGVVTVVSAGNEGVEAAGRSPASAGEAITVGAVDGGNGRPGWSNFGGAVDLFAPGVGVVSAWATGDGDVMEMEGTSMAAPHAAGVWEGVKGLATKEVVKDGGQGSPNLLAFNGAGEI
ncbi:subtilisin-like proteinase Mp1 [Schizothecium vesticola]|uniref:Subtilisin-like proteinase Mp1 n=1 Tax=Schizothecium vesticola TaxID=314040 RepID=A0AA40BNZ5_9PEZI|nr:subtilisin-like proteinase Mp1 [Schizothecium vesticola]